MVRRDDTREALRRLGVPVVEMWGDRPDPVDMLVGSSDYEGGRQMGRAFRRNGAVGGSPICGPPRREHALRLAGFVAGLAQHGLAPALVLPIEGEHSVSAGIDGLEAVLAAMPDCDAMFFGTRPAGRRRADRDAAARHRGARRARPRRLWRPRLFAEHVDPAITTVHVPDYELGHAAGAMLLRRLTTAEIVEPVIQVPVDLLPRASTERI